MPFDGLFYLCMRMVGLDVQYVLLRKELDRLSKLTSTAQRNVTARLQPCRLNIPSHNTLHRLIQDLGYDGTTQTKRGR